MTLLGAVASGAVARVVVLADDLTGAAAAAARLDAAGITVGCLPWDGDEDRVLADGVVATVRDTGTRAATATVASGRIARMAARVPEDALVVLRVDSTMRGHLAHELAALRRARDAALGRHRVVVAPAVPSAGRVTRRGRPWWAPPGATGLGEPVGHRSLADHLGIEGQLLTPEGTVSATDPHGDVVVDAWSDRHLARAADHLVSRPGGRWIVVDAGAFAPHVVHASTLAARPPTTLVVAGSRHERTRHQLEVLASATGAATVPVDPTAPDGAADRVRDLVRAGDPSVIVVPVEGRVCGSDLVAETLAQVAERGIDAGVRGVAVAGGHTAGAILRRLGVEDLRPVLEPFALGAAARGTTSGGVDLAVVTKGGAVGHDTVLLDAVTLLRSLSRSDDRPLLAALAGGHDDHHHPGGSHDLVRTDPSRAHRR